MFTGLVETKARILEWSRGHSTETRILKLEKPVDWTDLSTGESIAVNGCCLTLLDAEEDFLSFNLLEESIKVTSFRQISEGEFANLERSLTATDKMGGHFVSGHIDIVGTVEKLVSKDGDVIMTISHPEEFSKYIVPKGSIAINGVSLTVFEPTDGGFSVWLIPHTLEITNLGDMEKGSEVNLEFDLLAKYVEKLVNDRFGRNT